MPFAFLQNIFKVDANPNKVIEVKQDKYNDRTIVSRHDSIILYGIQNDTYEIVLHRPWSVAVTSFSLFRTNDMNEVQQTFSTIKDKIPNLVTISKDLYSLNGLQKMMDLLKEHPTWNIAHLAVELNRVDALNTPPVSIHMNEMDPLSGQTPLHLAIMNNNLNIVRMLINQGYTSLEDLDFEQNSVFHYAAKYAAKEIISLLSSQNNKCLNYRNANGYTPLHTACQNNKPDNVKELLKAGADVNIPATNRMRGGVSSPSDSLGGFLNTNNHNISIDDMKYGGTPLHWATSREVIEILIDMNCDINALDFHGNTALHKMVLKGRLDCVVALLCRNADIDLVDKDGNSAIHLAVKQNKIPIVQAIIVFGCNINALNGTGHTPRHIASIQPGDSSADKIIYLLHAVGANRCPSDLTGCDKGCKYSSDYNGTPPPLPVSPVIREVLRLYSLPEVKGDTKGGRLLCLDGGGIRGLILVTILLHLEKAVNQPIIHCFDWVAGSSTGAIVALGLAVGKTLHECLCLYFRMKDVAFVGNRPYNSEGLENTLKNSLGKDSVMSEITHPKIIITGVLADRKPVDLHLFCNYAPPSYMIDPTRPPGQFYEPPLPHEQLIWKAARASGAAPSYFRMFEKFVDGGLMSNNPTLDALTEIHEYNLALKSIGRFSEVKPPTLVVSIGTGVIPVGPMKEMDVYRPENITDTLRFVAGISMLGNVLIDQATQADGRVVDRARAWCSMINVPYYRFSPQLSEDIAMDEKSDEKLVNMLWETNAYMHANHDLVEHFALLLMGVH